MTITRETLREAIENKYNEYDLYADVCVKELLGDVLIVEVDINWGDWKHEHLKAKLLMVDIADELGCRLLDSYENVTEEDGSDCYSAVHTFYIAK